MNRIRHIQIDLNAFKIALQFANSQDPLTLHFDTPSRKFYFALIALIVHEMKHQASTGYINIRKYEKPIKFFDDALAGPHASSTIDGMWEKIRKAWNYSLPDLGGAAHFKIEGRDLKPPYEKGGKFVYECSEEEGNLWSSLFEIDEIENKWRFKFAINNVGAALDKVTIKLGDLQDDAAWRTFIDSAKTSLNESPSFNIDEANKPSTITRDHKNWIYYAVALTAVIIFVLGTVNILYQSLYYQPEISAPVTNERASIAVLPFINVSDEIEQDYFCDGITEELINHLASVKDLRVISRTSAFYFKDKGIDLRSIGEKLNVDNILEGSVRISGDKLRISAQLINVKDDSHIWAEDYDRDKKDIFDTQENLARNIACSLKSKLGCKQERDVAKRYTENVEAYNLYLRGLFFYNKTDFHKALDQFQRAINLDPDYALAYSGLANAYNYLTVFYAKSARDYYLRAKNAAIRAIEIDDELPEAYASLGKIKCSFEWDWEGAEIDLKKSIALNPNIPLSHRFYASYLMAVGRFEESINELKTALTLDPLSRGINARIGRVLYLQGKFDEAIKHLRSMSALYPNLPVMQNWLGLSLLKKGHFEEGIERLEHVTKITKRKTNPLGFLGYAYGSAGKISDAQKILNELLNRSQTAYVSPNSIAMVYIGMGNKNKALDWLEKAYEQKDTALYQIKTWSFWNSLHSDPRWSVLMRKMGFQG